MHGGPEGGRVGKWKGQEGDGRWAERRMTVTNQLALSLYLTKHSLARSGSGLGQVRSGQVRPDQVVWLTAVCIASTNQRGANKSEKL